MPKDIYTLKELTEIVNRYEKYIDGILRILENLTKGLSIYGTVIDSQKILADMNKLMTNLSLRQ